MAGTVPGFNDLPQPDQYLFGVISCCLCVSAGGWGKWLHNPGRVCPPPLATDPWLCVGAFLISPQWPHSYQAHWKQKSLTGAASQLSGQVREPLYGGGGTLGVLSVGKGMSLLLSGNRPWGPALWKGPLVHSAWGGVSTCRSLPPPAKLPLCPQAE